MENYHGILVDVSQKDKSIFDKLNVLGQKEDCSWILYCIGVENDRINDLIEELQDNMVEGFYFHFYKNNELIVVFKNKIFKTGVDKSSWGEILEYGISQGIPKKQLDFYPCKAEDEIY